MAPAAPAFSMPLMPVIADWTVIVICWKVAKAVLIATALPAPATPERVRTPRARTR